MNLFDKEVMDLCNVLDEVIIRQVEAIRRGLLN